MATLIKADGTEQEIHPKEKFFRFHGELYPLIAPQSEMIQAIHLADGRVMFMDEEGKAPWAVEFNEKATHLLHQAGGLPSDFIVGDVVICTPQEAGEGAEDE